MGITIPFTANALGPNVIISGDTNKPTIEITELVFQCGTATTIQMKSGSTPLTGPMPFTSGGNLNLANNGQGPHLMCTNGDDFVFVLSGLTWTCGGFVLYNQY